MNVLESASEILLMLLFTNLSVIFVICNVMSACKIANVQTVNVVFVITVSDVDRF